MGHERSSTWVLESLPLWLLDQDSKGSLCFFVASILMLKVPLSVWQSREPLIMAGFCSYGAWMTACPFKRCPETWATKPTFNSNYPKHNSTMDEHPSHHFCRLQGMRKDTRMAVITKTNVEVYFSHVTVCVQAIQNRKSGSMVQKSSLPLLLGFPIFTHSLHLKIQNSCSSSCHHNCIPGGKAPAQSGTTNFY